MGNYFLDIQYWLTHLRLANARATHPNCTIIHLVGCCQARDIEFMVIIGFAPELGVGIYAN